MRMSTDQFVLLPDQMYGNVSDHWSDDHQGDGEAEAEDCEDDFTSQQYLKEMERILRKIKRREARKVTFSKHLPGKKYLPFSALFEHIGRVKLWSSDILGSLTR